ncbi:hypothetical protein pb186bvf_013039 [Paramecium bursaria]
MLLLFLLQLLGTQSQFTNIEKSFIDGQSENQGYQDNFINRVVNFGIRQNLIYGQLCDQINHTSFFSPQAGIIKLVNLPPHNKIEITYQVVVVGPQDQENHVHGRVDQYQIVQQQNTSISNCQIFQMSYTPLTHYSESALIVIQGNGNDQQLWGIRDFIINTHNCPNSCQRCDQEEQCEQWKVIHNQTFDDSTDTIGSNINFQLQNEQMNITQQQFSENYKAWISFLYLSYNDDDQITLKIDNDIKTFKNYNEYQQKIIFSNTRIQSYRIGYQYDGNLSNESLIQIQSREKLWGIRDLYIYVARDDLKNEEQSFQGVQNLNQNLIINNSLLQGPQDKIYELIHEYDLYADEDYFANQYVVRNGLKGDEITSILHGGEIIGGYQIFDRNTRVSKIFKGFPQVNNIFRFQIQLYLIGNPQPDDYISIKFKNSTNYDLIDYDIENQEFKFNVKSDSNAKSFIDSITKQKYYTLRLAKNDIQLFYNYALYNQIIKFEIYYKTNQNYFFGASTNLPYSMNMKIKTIFVDIIKLYENIHHQIKIQ